MFFSFLLFADVRQSHQLSLGRFINVKKKNVQCREEYLIPETKKKILEVG